jgi:hypothetical protein
VAGNVADVMGGVVNAVASGLVAAASLNANLVEEDVRLAVESRRAPFSAGAERAVAERVLADRVHGV